MRIATFNVQNLRLRQGPGGSRLDGAVDRDMHLPSDPELDLGDRRLTARVVARLDADVLCLQEVFDKATLDHFHEVFLLPEGARPYPWRMCLGGNDGHGLNVAVMSRLPPDELKSHSALTAADLGLSDPGGLLHGGPVFRRDCLMVRFGALTLFVCHLKAPYPDRERALAIRALEAQAIRRIVEATFADPATGFWMILGDLNGPSDGGPVGDRALAPLLDGFGIDLMARLPTEEDWTFRMPDSGKPRRPDALIASPVLARIAARSIPGIDRSGMAPVGADPRPHASDHAAVWIDLPDLTRIRP